VNSILITKWGLGGGSSNDLKDLLVEKDEPLKENLKQDGKIKTDFVLHVLGTSGFLSQSKPAL
jgi:hypothetical protein